jgi:copper homeostasis protein
VAPAKRIVIEACVSSLKDALAAARMGADRLEFCSALEVGGLTPDFEQVARLRECVSVPIMAMVRPRAGDFHYSDSEWRRMLDDAGRLLRLGADGIVFGALLATEVDVSREAKPSAPFEDTLDPPTRRSAATSPTREEVDSTESRLTINVARTAEMAAFVHGEGKVCVFHKAFDETSDLLDSMRALAAVGIDRVLTSGGVATALDGAATLKSLIDGGGPMVVIGGGVRAENVSEILRRTGGTEIHSSCRSIEPDVIRLDQKALARLIDAVRTFETAS